MARLEFEITGTTAGLSKSVTAAIGLLDKLQAAGDKLNLFQNAAQGANNLSGAIGGLTNQVRSYTTAAQRGTQAWNDKTAENAISSLSNKLIVIRGNAELFGMSLQTDQQALRAYQGALNSLLSAGLTPTDAKIQLLKGHIDELTSSISKQKAGLNSSSGGFGAFGNQLNGLLTSYISIFAVIRGVGAVISSNAEISDSLADVRRTASLTQPEVEKLFESLKKIDTRTSLKGLVDIAVIGGQLGIATNQLSGFTKATDQLAVALSGELKGGPEEVAKSLGILNNVFGISKQNGGDVERAFNQIGSVILHLGQSGSATGEFLSSFGQTVGGVAANAKLSIPVLLSYGAVLQEQGVTAEVASSSFKRLIGLLATRRGDFLAVAQFADSTLTLKSFTDLINNDTNKALQLFFDGLKRGGSTTTAFSDLVKSIGGDGVRTSQALTALARHMDDVNKHINDEVKVMNDGTVAADQFAIKNDTLGASVDKLSKSFVTLTTSGNTASFFKGIIDGLTQLINGFDGFINSKSYAEFQRNFGNAAAGALRYSLGGYNPGGIFNAVQAPQPFNSRTNYINGNLQAFNGLNRAQQSSAIVTTTAARDRAFNIASDPQATKKQITDYNDINKLLDLMRHSYDALYNSKKANIGADGEIADADLKTTKAIHARIAELRNDALANPGNKDVDVSRIQALTARLKELSGAATGAGQGLRNISLSKQLSDILDKGVNSSSVSGLSGYAKSVQEINNRYATLNKQLDEFNQKVNVEAKTGQITGGKAGQLTAQSNAVRDALQVQKAKELSDARIAEATRVANEVQRINDEFGVKSQTGRDKELAAIQKMYDAEVTKAAGNKDILKALDADRLVAIQSVADKYEAIQADLYDKINTINATANAAISGKEESQTQKIVNEWEARRKAANGYYDELIKLNAGSNVASDVPSVAQGMQGITAARLANAKAGTNSAISKGESSAVSSVSGINTLLNKTFDSSIRQLGSSFSNTLTTIGQQGNATFSDIFSNLQKDISKSLVSTVTKFATDYLGDALKKGITNGTGNLADIFKNGISGGTAAIGGLGIAGSLVSGLTPKTSSAGQAIGGALTGAALGTAVLPGIGTAVGGVVGAAAGLFGAKGARKKEQQLQEQQLAEAKQQTALLRQQAQAYTSSIIGRMTESGVITGVEIDALGKLTATVSGKDLQFVLDRNNNGR